MNKDFFDTLLVFENEKGIDIVYLIEKVSSAIMSAIKKGYGVSDENIIVDIDANKSKFYVAIKKVAVENVEDSVSQIQINEAKKYNKKVNVGEFVEIPISPDAFGLSAAQAAKQIIRQGIREAERIQTYKELKSKFSEIVTASVLKVDKKFGNLIVDMGNCQSILPKNEQVPNEVFVKGDYIKVYVMDIQESEKGPKVKISRINTGLVKRLFEIEVPEIVDGVVEVKSISRDAGVRSKVAVYSKDDNVDAVGSCIGTRGSRVDKIIEELRGEKIDIIKYSEDIKEFVKESLAPAKVISVDIVDEQKKQCKVIVPDTQLSLAIGNKGSNVRLAAKLTGWKIDIKPESGFYGEEEEK